MGTRIILSGDIEVSGMHSSILRPPHAVRRSHGAILLVMKAW